MKKILILLPFLPLLIACTTHSSLETETPEDEATLKERKIRAIEAMGQSGHKTTHLKHIENNSSGYKVNW
jgi:hypothetical protein